ncbi:MAG TPA: phosphoglycerate kinase [Bdellovibrionota bacterium]|nr:phosphoglycerate kinase [Bdellovibrionota bacterium]
MEAPAQGRRGSIRSIRDLDLKNQRVFIRVDFNVPISDAGEVEDDNRICEALPTIRHAIEQRAKVILGSHLGRPKAKPEPKYSLEPVAHHLAKLLEMEVTLADDCVGEGIELMTQNLKQGQVLLLENLRFHGGEEANSPDFVNGLARLADVYVNDAFGTSHRKHASVYGLPKAMANKGMGFLIEKELKYMNLLLDNPPRPFHLILGGAKVSDKIETVQSLMRRTDSILIGGAMAFAFQAAQGESVPANAKQPAPEDVQAAATILRDAKKVDLPITLPADLIESFDIGPKTVERFCRVLESAKTVFWNGPLGWFEKPEYAGGTFAIAKYLAGRGGVLKVVGGGDTVSAVKASGFEAGFDHLSTGGGAVLEYLVGDGLPGIDVLRQIGRHAPAGPLSDSDE